MLLPFTNGQLSISQKRGSILRLRDGLTVHSIKRKLIFLKNKSFSTKWAHHKIGVLPKQPNLIIVNLYIEINGSHVQFLLLH